MVHLNLPTVAFRALAFGLLTSAFLGFLACKAEAQTTLPLQWTYSPITMGEGVAYSPDGSLIAVAGNGGVQIFSALTNTLVRCLPGPAIVGSVAFSPDAKTLAGAAQTSVQLWNVSTGSEIASLIPASVTVSSVAFSPDGTTLAASGNNNSGITSQPVGALQTWNVSTGQLVTFLNTDLHFLSGIAYSPDGKTIAAAGFTGSNGALETVDATTLKEIALFSSSASSLTAVAFSPDGKTLVGGGAEVGGVNGHGVLDLWNVSTGALTTSLASGWVTVSAVAFSPDGKVLAGGGMNTQFAGGAEQWNLSTGALSATLTSSTNDAVYSLAFSPDGKSLATCGTAEAPPSGTRAGPYFAELDLWSASTNSLAATVYPAFFTSASKFAISPDGATIALGGTAVDHSAQVLRNWVGLLDSSTGKLNSSLAPAGVVNSVAFSSDGTMLADAGYSLSGYYYGPPLLEIWSLSSGKLSQSLPSTITNIQSVGFSADGTKIAAGGFTSGSEGQVGALELWSVTTGKLIAALPTNITKGVASVALSSDGVTLAACGSTMSSLGFEYGVLEIWNTSTGNLIESLDTGILDLYTVAFSSDGKSLADGGSRYIPSDGALDSGLELWNMSTAGLLSSFPAISGSGVVYSVGFSPDGLTLFAATGTGLKAFSTLNYSLLNSFAGGGITWLAVSPTGKQLILMTPYGQLEAASNPLNTSIPIASLSLNPTAVIGGMASTGTVTLSAPASTEGQSVVLTSANANASVPGNVVVPAGATSATFTVKTVGVAVPQTGDITATIGTSSKTATLAMTPTPVASLTLSPTTVIAGNTSIGTITLTQPAPPNGAYVELSTNSPGTSVPGIVMVPPGLTSTTFQVGTYPVPSTTVATITAGIQASPASAILTVSPGSLVSFVLSPTTVAGGNISTGTLTLNGFAPTGGLVVSLSSNSPTASVPATVTFEGIQTQKTFSVTTTAVSAQKTVSITAASGEITKVGSLTITTPSLASVQFNPGSVTGGATSLCTVALNGQAPKGGAKVLLSSNLSTVTVSASVLIPAGSTSVRFTAKTVAVASQKVATVKARYAGLTVTGTITVTPPVLTSMSLTPASVKGGKSSIGKVTVGSPAPSGGLVISLASSMSSATAPKTVTIPAGKTSATFTVKTKSVKSSTTATITSTFAGASLSSVLTIS
jgi:WD40 repeat protein